MSDLVKNPNGWFSHAHAHIVYYFYYNKGRDVFILPFGSKVYPRISIDLLANSLDAYCRLCYMVTLRGCEESHVLSSAQDPDCPGPPVQYSAVQFLPYNYNPALFLLKLMVPPPHCLSFL